MQTRRHELHATSKVFQAVTQLILFVNHNHEFFKCFFSLFINIGM